jgi:hypothetical protein
VIVVLFGLKTEHAAARDFDLGGGFQHSGNYPMVFQHSVGREILTLGEGFNTSQVSTLCGVST